MTSECFCPRKGTSRWQCLSDCHELMGELERAVNAAGYKEGWETWLQGAAERSKSNLPDRRAPSAQNIFMRAIRDELSAIRLLINKQQ